MLCVRLREVLSVRERQRDTETDGSDVTIVALKLAMNLHFPLPKIRTFRFCLHTSHISPFLDGHHCGAEIRNEFTLSVAKNFRPLCSDSIKWRLPRSSSHRKNESN